MIEILGTFANSYSRRVFMFFYFREFLIWSAIYSFISISYRSFAAKNPESEWKTSFDQFCTQVNRFTVHGSILPKLMDHLEMISRGLNSLEP